MTTTHNRTLRERASGGRSLCAVLVLAISALTQGCNPVDPLCSTEDEELDGDTLLDCAPGALSLAITRSDEGAVRVIAQVGRDFVVVGANVRLRIEGATFVDASDDLTQTSLITSDDGRASVGIVTPAAGRVVVRGEVTVAHDGGSRQQATAQVTYSVEQAPAQACHFLWNVTPVPLTLSEPATLTVHAYANEALTKPADDGAIVSLNPVDDPAGWFSSGDTQRVVDGQVTFVVVPDGPNAEGGALNAQLVGDATCGTETSVSIPLVQPREAEQVVVSAGVDAGVLTAEVPYPVTFTGYADVGATELAAGAPVALCTSTSEVLVSKPETYLSVAGTGNAHLLLAGPPLESTARVAVCPRSSGCTTALPPQAGCGVLVVPVEVP